LLHPKSEFAPFFYDLNVCRIQYKSEDLYRMML